MGFVRQILQLVPIELNIHHRGQRPGRHRYHGDEIVRLGLPRAVIAEKVIGSHPHARSLCVLPVGGKLPVLKGAPLCGLDKGEIHTLCPQGRPVHIPLISGDVHAEHLPLARVSLLRQQDIPPPAQEMEEGHGGCGQQQKQQEQAGHHPETFHQFDHHATSYGNSAGNATGI